MIDTIIFDLGGVLIDWNPMYVYKNYFDNDEKLAYFFEHVCTGEWNENQDAGKLLAEATEERVALFPEWEKPIRDYYGRWQEMLGHALTNTVEVLKQLKQGNQYKLYALTNWSHETFPVALEKFEFLQWFEGILVSGAEKTRKPFPEIYELILQRYNINASTAVFIDDNKRNVSAAENAGINAIHFTSAMQLKEELKKLGVDV